MLCEREKMLGGELYAALDPELVKMRRRARDLCQALNGTAEAQQDGHRGRVRRRQPPPRIREISEPP